MTISVGSLQYQSLCVGTRNVPGRRQPFATRLEQCIGVQSCEKLAHRPYHLGTNPSVVHHILPGWDLKSIGIGIYITTRTRTQPISVLHQLAMEPSVPTLKGCV